MLFPKQYCVVEQLIKDLGTVIEINELLAWMVANKVVFAHIPVEQ